MQKKMPSKSVLMKLIPKNELISQASSIAPSSQKTKDLTPKGAAPFTASTLANKRKKGGELKIIN